MLTHEVGLAALIVIAAIVLPVAATPATAAVAHTVLLRHTTYAPQASATARITRSRRGVYSVRLTAIHLPGPTTLQVRPLRHVYALWAYDGRSRGTPERAIPLVYHTGTGAYTAAGSIAMSHITELFITADVTGAQRGPTTPEVSVLSSTGQLQL